MASTDNETKIDLLNNKAIATTIVGFPCHTLHSMVIEKPTPSNKALVFK